ncbi:hypothetical protein [Acrocarpospora sp. B8E8]|uniref:hypothetical protein n=1 Tax=Acrocarpospora sp. B8E8 TaxID=3153572 RepID=UPI00325D3B40
MILRRLGRRLADRLDRRYLTRAELTRLLAARDLELSARQARLSERGVELAAQLQELIAQAKELAEERTKELTEELAKKLVEELAEARHRAEQAYWLAWDTADSVERLLQADLRLWQAIDTMEGDRARRMD